MFKTAAKPGHEDHHRHRELQFILAVAIGVTMELIGLGHAIPEAIKLEGTVETLSAENLVLRPNVAVVEIKAKGRKITS